jgi:flagellar biosynthesis chaperone FliJ
LAEARQRREALERHRERQLEAHRLEQLAEEARELDEIATMRAARRAASADLVTTGGDWS